VLTVLDGQVTVVTPEETWQYGRGRTVLLPAALSGFSLQGTRGSLALLSWVPDLAAEVIEPAREAGLPDESIAALGGHPAHNDLLPLLN
jgi:mannose-6-phosphate isomerase